MSGRVGVGCQTQPISSSPDRLTHNSPSCLPACLEHPTGLRTVVKSRCTTHSDGEQRKLAHEVLRKWDPPVPAGRPGSAQASASGAPRAPSRPAQQQQQQAVPRPPMREDLAAYIDAERAAELAELQRQADAAKAAAEALKAELAVQQAQQATGVAAGEGGAAQGGAAPASVAIQDFEVTGVGWAGLAGRECSRVEVMGRRCSWVQMTGREFRRERDAWQHAGQSM